MGQAGRHRDHRDARHVGGELRDVDGLAAADPGHRLVLAGPQFLAERDRRVVAAVGHAEELSRADGQLGRDRLTLTGPDGDGDASFDRDPVVGEQRPEIADGTGPDVDDQRGREHPRQQRHGPPCCARFQCPL